MKYTICTIIKNEQYYLEEWINHNLSIGFTDIYLYEDDGSDTHKYITDKFDNVYLNRFSDCNIKQYSLKQQALFEWFILNYKDKYDWCAFIDVDEYIRFEDGWTLDKLCKMFKDKNGIYIQQKTYGANGHLTKPIGGLQENYTSPENVYRYHREKANMKSIVNLHKNNLSFSRKVHKVAGGVFTNGINRQRDICYQKCWYDHYYTKSWEEWKARFIRGDVKTGNCKPYYFFFYNKQFELQRKEMLNELVSNRIEPYIWLDFENRMLSNGQILKDKGNMEIIKKDFPLRIAEINKEYQMCVLIKEHTWALLVPKCGLSSMVYLGDLFHKNNLNLSYNVYDIPRMGSVYYEYLNNIPKGDTVIVVCIDPVSRFKSYYKNKILNEKKRTHLYCKYNLKNATIDETIAAIETELKSNLHYNEIDNHILPQHCFYSNRIDKIIEQKDIIDYLKTIGINNYEIKNITNSSTVELTDSQIDRIKELYKEDYELLNRTN